MTVGQRGWQEDHKSWDTSVRPELSKGRYEMIRKLISIFVLMSHFTLIFVNQTMAECQIGAVLGGTNTTFSGDDEQGIVNYEKIIQRKIACVKIYKKIIDEFPFRECLTIYNHDT